MSTTLIVGADQQFHTIAAAITAANTIAGGAIIEIVAGTYVNDGGTITGDNVTIEGVGGFAKLVGASVGSGDFAAITLAGNHDVIANLDVCGVTKGYGIFLQAGTFNTIENVDVHGNQEGCRRRLRSRDTRV